MNRRQVLQSLGLISAHTLFPTVLTGFLASCNNKDADFECEFFNADELKTIVEVIDIIIPATKTLSASQTKAQYFLDQVFAKCLTGEQQKIIKSGIALMATGLAGTKDKKQYITGIDKKAFDNNDEYAFFKTIKQYTLIGFFTSQEGTTKASNYVKVPDEYKGEVPVTENTLNYGRTNLQYNL
jgi:glucoside 3-dehydrogenase (cytochrome c) hitch-hiker subunit